jgi:hypothetical protein
MLDHKNTVRPQARVSTTIPVLKFCLVEHIIRLEKPEFL